MGQNVCRCEKSCKGSPCQNAILWTLLFTPHAQLIKTGANRPSCLLHGGRNRVGAGATEKLEAAVLCLLSFPLGGIYYTNAHTFETWGSILACCLSSCYAGFWCLWWRVISQDNKETDHMLMCSQGPGTGVQFLLGGAPGYSPCGGVVWGFSKEWTQGGGGGVRWGVCRGEVCMWWY